MHSKKSYQTVIYICANDSELGEEVEVFLEGDYYHGCAETCPTFACAGEPAEPPEIDITEVCVKKSDGSFVDISWLLPSSVFEELEEKFLNNILED